MRNTVTRRNLMETAAVRIPIQLFPQAPEFLRLSRNIFLLCSRSRQLRGNRSPFS